jgi:hypothetical protein
MRLVKRRSTPVIEHDPLPSTSSLVDLGGPGIASTSTGPSSPPSLRQRHSDLDVRFLPNGTPLLRSTSTTRFENQPGPDYSDAGEAHTTRTGGRNVLTASTNANTDAEDPRRSGELSPKDVLDVTMAGSKRNSGGQNRYPPNSLVPGNGWGFGLMRRSRKQDLTIVPPLPLRRDSLS